MSMWGRKSKDAVKAETDGSAIGLTQAFASVDEDALPVKRGRHARHAADEGNAMGLTQAFAPVDADGFSGSSAGFHADPDDFEGDAWMPDDEAWSSYGGYEKSLDGFDVMGGEEERAVEGDSAFADASDDLPSAPAVGALDVPEKPAKRGRHARHAAPAADEFGSAEGAVDSSESGLSVTSVEATAADGAPRSKGSKDEVPAYLRKSRRMRRILTAVIVLLVLLLAAGAFFAWQRLGADASSARQQAQTLEVSTDIQGAEASDSASASVKKTSAPDLVSLMGLTQDEAVEALQHGAQVSATSEVNEADNPVKTEVRVALTAEPADTRTGTPTVYLGLDADGRVVQAGYSTSSSSLGYGSLSFSDAVQNEHIIEKTLAEVGLSVEEGSVSLPADRAAYSTYASDGKTLVKEYCSFEGEAEGEGGSYTWSAVLSYDYSTANATGNLTDTVRLVYVYVNA